MKSIAKQLKEFLTEENWTQGTFARDEKNEPVLPNSPLACKFCVAGAISHIYGGEFFGVPEVYIELMRRAVTVLSNNDIVSIGIYNDRAESFNEISSLLDLYEQYENEELELIANQE